MYKQIVDNLRARLAAYDELAAQLDDVLLHEKLDVPRNKSLAEHLWCVVGARESYARALDEGAWVGFGCSLTQFAAEDFRTKLAESGSALMQSIDSVEEWDGARSTLLAKLAEHEVMHEGQIIRHMYALERELPESWAWA